jgi:hypothetical protein
MDFMRVEREIEKQKEMFRSDLLAFDWQLVRGFSIIHPTIVSDSCTFGTL